MRISDWSSDVCSSYLEIKIVLAVDVLRDLQQNLLDLAHPLAEPLIEAAAQLLRLALQGFGVRLQLRPLLGIGLRRQRGAALGKVAVGRAQGLLTTLHLRLGPVAPRLDLARQGLDRSEERRVGKGVGSHGRS